MQSKIAEETKREASNRTKQARTEQELKRKQFRKNAGQFGSRPAKSSTRVLSCTRLFFRPRLKCLASSGRHIKSRVWTPRRIANDKQPMQAHDTTEIATTARVNNVREQRPVKVVNPPDFCLDREKSQHNDGFYWWWSTGQPQICYCTSEESNSNFARHSLYYYNYRFPPDQLTTPGSIPFPSCGFPWSRERSRGLTTLDHSHNPYTFAVIA